MAEPSRPLPPPSDDDPFLVLASGKEGGFVSLEEIDESQYAFIGGAFEPLGGEESKRNKKRDTKNASSSFESKKRKRGGDSAVEDDVRGEKETEKKRPKKKKNKKKKKNSRNKKKSDQVEAPENGENKDGFAEGKVEGDIREELLLREDEVYAWTELRLHPLLIKSIRRLGFREPTPIQKACIPAAAHQGKDVIGAAETGSGKTLAFGLPILQRFLDEREKVARSVQEDGKSAEERVKGGPLRALIVTPTRELALQVDDQQKVSDFSLIKSKRVGNKDAAWGASYPALDVCLACTMLG